MSNLPGLPTCEAALAEAAFHLGSSSVKFDMLSDGFVALAHPPRCTQARRPQGCCVSQRILANVTRASTHDGCESQLRRRARTWSLPISRSFCRMPR
jgi:hypothetical protein